MGKKLGDQVSATNVLNNANSVLELGSWQNEAEDEQNVESLEQRAALAVARYFINPDYT